MANCIVKIRCGNCKKNWEVYWRDIRHGKSNICPFCGKEIDRLIWDRDIYNAAAAALEANMQLEKDARGYQKPGFSVNLIYRKDV